MSALPSLPLGDTSAPWQRMLLRFGILFVGLSAFLLPFPYHVFPNPGSLLQPLTEAWVAAVSGWMGRAHPKEISSDSASMYVLMGSLLLLSLPLAWLWAHFSRKGAGDHKLFWAFLVGMRYYLAAILFSYGFNKVFKTQFYLPEPNTLASPVGELSPDLLFWTSMGVSRAYCIFTGALEVLAAALLLFRPSRLPGAVLAAAIMGNVLAINLAFDISVKLFSAFLLLQSLLLILPDFKRMLAFLKGNPTAPNKFWHPNPVSKNARTSLLLLKSGAVCLILFESLFGYFQAWNFNDDLAPRPALHGYFDVGLFVQDGDTIPPDLRANRWKRVFLHRQGYFIAQDMQDGFEDFKIVESETGGRHVLLDGFRQPAGTLEVSEAGPGKLRFEVEVRGKKLELLTIERDWRKLPLFNGSFHWTSDEM